MNKSSVVFDLSNMTIDLAGTQESISFICKSLNDSSSHDFWCQSWGYFLWLNICGYP